LCTKIPPNFKGGVGGFADFYVSAMHVKAQEKKQIDQKTASKAVAWK
jgi:hypothetical protein